MGSSKTGEKKILSLLAMGSALEYYDFIIFAFLAVYIGHNFLPPEVPEWVKQLQVFSILALGYLIRPAAGAVYGHFGDKIGRKKTFIFTVFGMAIPTLCIGLMPSYAHIGVLAPILLLILRMIQGLAFSGELPGASVYLSESVNPTRVGRSVGALHGSQFVGLLLGSFLTATLAKLLSAEQMDDYGWRIPFIVGGVLGLIATMLRAYLQESPAFQRIKMRREGSVSLPLKEVFLRHRAALLAIVLIGFFTSEVIICGFVFLPNYLIQHYNVPADLVFTSQMLASLMFVISNPLWGLLSDRIGLRKALSLGCVLTCIYGLVFFGALPSIISSPSILLISWIGFGLLGGAAGLLLVAAVSFFPAEVRFTGFSVPFNVSAGLFAGLSPIFLAATAYTFPLSPAFLLAAGSIAGLAGGLLNVPRYLGTEHLDDTSVALVKNNGL